MLDFDGLQGDALLFGLLDEVEAVQEESHLGTLGYLLESVLRIPYQLFEGNTLEQSPDVRIKQALLMGAVWGPTAQDTNLGVLSGSGLHSLS